MDSSRWKVRELNPFDLIPDTSLINVFITATKSSDISDDYHDFKSIRSKSPQRIRYKYHPPFAKDKKLVKYEGPRLNKELPKSIQIPLLKNRSSKTQSPVHSNQKAENFIEELIRNRQEIVLPSLEKQKISNFIKTRGQIAEERRVKCETLLQSIKGDMKNKKYRVESEMKYWDTQPMRKWDYRSDRVLVQKKFQNLNRSVGVVEEELSFEENTKKRNDVIGSIIEACGDDIMNWPS